MRLMKRVFSVLAIMAFAACSGLPKKSPADLAVNMSISGGMRPVSVHYYISRTRSWASVSVRGKTRKYSFSVSTDEIDRLYGLFRVNRFASISVRRERVYDRGGVTISIGWGGRSIVRSNAGMHFVKKADLGRFNAVRRELTRLVRYKLRSRKFTMPR